MGSGGLSSSSVFAANFVRSQESAGWGRRPFPVLLPTDLSSLPTITWASMVKLFAQVIVLTSQEDLTAPLGSRKEGRVSRTLCSISPILTYHLCPGTHLTPLPTGCPASIYRVKGRLPAGPKGRRSQAAASFRRRWWSWP